SSGMSLIVTFEDLPRYLTISCLTLPLLLSQVFFTRYAYKWPLTFLSLMNTIQVLLIQFCRQLITEPDFCINNDMSSGQILSVTLATFVKVPLSLKTINSEFMKKV